MQLVYFAALITFAYYLFGRAEITRWWWEGVLQERSQDPSDAEIGTRREPWRYRLRRFLDSLATCPACSGFWLGLAAWPLFDVPAPGWPHLRWIWGGVWGLLLCPAGMALLAMALERSKVREFDPYIDPPPEPWGESEAPLCGKCRNPMQLMTEAGIPSPGMFCPFCTPAPLHVA